MGKTSEAMDRPLSIRDRSARDRVYFLAVCSSMFLLERPGFGLSPIPMSVDNLQAVKGSESP